MDMAYGTISDESVFDKKMEQTEQLVEMMNCQIIIKESTVQGKFWLLFAA